MADREKVMLGIEACANSDIMMQCSVCPYHEIHQRCVTTIMRDALALLKEQEPRVMTWREIVHSIEIEAPAIWLEDRDKIHIIPALTIISSVTNSENATFVIRGKRIDVNYRDYGKRWRAWTARPTEDQRKAVKWDE